MADVPREEEEPEPDDDEPDLLGVQRYRGGAGAVNEGWGRRGAAGQRRRAP